MPLSRLLQGRAIWFGIVLLVTAGLLVASREIFREPAPPGIALADLTSLDQLQTRFNEDRGVARLVLIVSPT